jgi:phage terminase Nu1 subunit (DNA packaging protein)
MQKQILQIENIEATDLLNRLDRMENAIAAALANQPQTTQDTAPNYITRKEVARLFKISLVTVNDWTRKGILTAYKVANRVYYKPNEVESALVQKGGVYVQ